MAGRSCLQPKDRQGARPHDHAAGAGAGGWDHGAASRPDPGRYFEPNQPEVRLTMGIVAEWTVNLDPTHSGRWHPARARSVPAGRGVVPPRGASV